MEIQKSFSKTAFGGFNKEEVTQYIGEMIAKNDEEVTTLKSDIENANAQIAELKSIIEEQYKKIVEITEVQKTLKNDKEQNLNKIKELEQELKPYRDAQVDVKVVMEAAKKEASEVSYKLKQQVSETTQQAKYIIEQANQKANEIIEPARAEVELLLDSAKKQSNDIIAQAKMRESHLLEQAKTQVDKAILMSDENKKKSERILDEATKEAESIIAKARVEADSQKESFETCIKALEIQKSKLLLSLDEIKSDVQAIQISHSTKNEVEPIPMQILKQTTSEILRKKLANLTKEHQGGNFRN